MAAGKANSKRQSVAWCILVLASNLCQAENTSTALDVTLGPAQAQDTILRAVHSIPAQREEHRRYRMAVSFGDPLFPPDAELSSPALAHWRALTLAQRRYDVLVTPDVDYFWVAEGRRYSTSFVIHVEPGARDGAHLDLLQVHPTIYAGKHFKLIGRTGPGRYLDLRKAPPSEQAAAELRAFLATALDR